MRKRRSPPGPVHKARLSVSDLVRRRPQKQPLRIQKILQWADAHFDRTGRWPTPQSGPIRECEGENWSIVNQALMKGNRGLPKGGSLARLLTEWRWKRNHLALEPFSISRILAWADSHFRRTASWPRNKSGTIPEAPGEKWSHVDFALREGLRGMPGGSSLAELLERRRGVRHHLHLPRLSEAQVARWALLHFRRTKTWPTVRTGPVIGAPGETWKGIESALWMGARGLGPRLTTSRVLERQGIRHVVPPPRYTARQILAWADAHFQRTGSWPKVHSGKIPEAPEESWAKIQNAMQNGTRGLERGQSLGRFLAKHRDVRNRAALSPLTIEEILRWADDHHQRTGAWPSTVTRGPVLAQPSETWTGIQNALHNGRRGLRGGDSLPRLLQRKRAIRNRKALPPFSTRQILAWADTEFERSGQWPTAKLGPVAEAPQETWGAVNQALHRGLRGLPGGSSLQKLLRQRPDRISYRRKQGLSEALILQWADAFRVRTGRWPTPQDGQIPEAPADTWRIVQSCLTARVRGLSGPHRSLLALLSAKRGARNQLRLPPLTVKQIQNWAHLHREFKGSWPTMSSGPVLGAPGETWNGINHSLKHGKRTLPAGLSLSVILAPFRESRQLSLERVKEWVREHYKRTGRWPTSDSGEIPRSGGENWGLIDQLLRKGLRGLSGGTSVAALRSELAGAAQPARRRP